MCSTNYCRWNESMSGLIVKDISASPFIVSAIQHDHFVGITEVKDVDIRELKYLGGGIYYKDKKFKCEYNYLIYTINYAQKFLLYWNIDAIITVEEILNGEFLFELETQGISITVRTQNFIDFYEEETRQHFIGFQNIPDSSPKFSWWNKYIAGLQHRYNVTF